MDDFKQGDTVFIASPATQSHYIKTVYIQEWDAEYMNRGLLFKTEEGAIKASKKMLASLNRKRGQRVK